MVVCLHDFKIESLGFHHLFIKGHKYAFRLEYFDFICDEMITIYVNNIPITKSTFKENFIRLEDWRHQQLNKVI